MPCNLLPPQLWQSVPFGDKDAFLDWSIHHQLWMQALAQKTKTPMLTFDDLRVELLRHAELHVAIDKALGIAPAFDLVSYDLSERSSYYSFMETHGLLHANERKAANL